MQTVTLQGDNHKQWISALNQVSVTVFLSQWHRKYALSIHYRGSIEWRTCNMESTTHCLYLGRINPGPSKVFTVPFICGLNRKIAIIHVPDGEWCLKWGLVIPGTLLLAFSVQLFVHFYYRGSRKSLGAGFPSSAVSNKLDLFDLF